MNYLAHALPFFEQPYFAAATGVPDWLSVADRRVRLRSKHVEPFLRDDDPILAAVAGGVAQHLRDDAQFHGTRAFFEVSARLSELARKVLGDEQGLGANFLGHLLCELLLDAALAVEDLDLGQSREGEAPAEPREDRGLSATLTARQEARPPRGIKRPLIQRYYDMLDQIDPALIESAVNRMAPRATGRLVFFVGEFRRARILWDYLEDGKLMVRLNQVMRRVGLPLLPDVFATILPEARQIVAERKAELLSGIPVAIV
jgi:hypothetical protein